MTLDDKVANHSEAIANLEGRMDSAELRLAQHDGAISKLTDAITVLREGMARVATKDDVIALGRTISEQHTAELRDAHNSVPTRVMMIVSLVTLALTFAGFALLHFHG